MISIIPANTIQGSSRRSIEDAMSPPLLRFRGRSRSAAAVWEGTVDPSLGRATDTGSLARGLGEDGATTRGVFTTPARPLGAVRNRGVGVDRLGGAGDHLG